MMMLERGDDPPPSTLRGWLSEVYFPALLERELEPLVRRLGERATIDDPMFGRASGLPAVEQHVRAMADWLVARGASYTRAMFMSGIDRDVTEGALALASGGDRLNLPVAVVAERRRSREVELRIHYATGALHAPSPTQRTLFVGPRKELPLPPLVAEHLAALRKGDKAALFGSFEPDASVRDACGIEHTRATGALERFYDRLLNGRPFGKGVELAPCGSADDGRTCVMEYTLLLRGNPSVPSKAGLVVFERGDNGRLCAVRWYGEFTV